MPHGLSREGIVFITAQAIRTRTGRATSTAVDRIVRRVAGRSKRATAGKTMATAAPVPKHWLATSMASTATMERRTEIGCDVWGVGAMTSNAISVAVVARTWP